jgi:hypothetical protein
MCPLTFKVEAVDMLSSYEERILEAILEEGTVKEAAYELGVKPATIYTVISHVRFKLVRAQNTVNRCNRLKQKSHTLRRLLVPLTRVAVPAEKAEEESEGDYEEQALAVGVDT